jgi:hypothetical protein
MRKLTIEEAESRCPSMVKGQKWNGVEDKYWFVCNTHGKYLQRYMSHQIGYGCDECGGSKTLTSEFAESTFPEMVKGQKWVGTKNKYWFECKIHGKYLQTYGHHCRGQRCPECGIEKYSKKRCLSIEEAESRFSDMVRNQKWTGARDKYWFICKIHGKYKQIYYSHQSGNGCSDCKESHGEKKVAEILVNLGIQFSRELRIPECRDKKALPFDFSVDLDKKYLIEFHGIQHYRVDEFWGGIKALKVLQKHDRIKKSFCKRNGIPLLVIKHTAKNIEEKIRKFLQIKGPTK